MMKTSKNRVVAGMDACRGGWFVVLVKAGSPSAFKDHRVSSTFAEAVAWAAEAETIAVDIPIGLVERGFRVCDVMAKKFLGARGCCVFLAPPRPVLAAKTYAEAKVIHAEHCDGKLMTIQAFGILHKIAEVDEYLRSNRNNGRICEVHPEVCFASLNDCRPVLSKKDSREGRAARLRLLRHHFADADDFLQAALGGYLRRDLQPDDILDAAIAAVTAAKWDPAATIPGPTPPVDAYGLRMEMRRPVCIS